MHEFDTGEGCRSRLERFETQHRSYHTFDGAMVLLDDVVEIFDLTNFDIGLVFRIEAFDCRRVGPAFVDCDLLRCAVLTERLAQKAQCSLTVPLGSQ